MLHRGDITKIKGNEVPLVDVVCGGSPCQDLSVAGLRKGLQHSDLGDGETTRSGLFMEQIRIIKEMRDESTKQLLVRGADVDRRCIQPRFMVWENVPGAFSSNKGEDFRCVLEETAKIVCKDATIPMPAKWSPSGCIMGDGWSIAWRVHDAQFWGIPQRRKRIALVADFGGSSAPEILFERKSVSGHLEPRREERKTTPGVTVSDTTETISFQERVGCEGASVLQEKVYCLQANGIDRADTAGCNGKGWREDESYTLNTIDRHAVCYGVDCYNQTQSEEVSKSLSSAASDSDHIPCVYGLDRASFNQGKNALYDFSVAEEKAQTIVAKGPGGGY